MSSMPAVRVGAQIFGSDGGPVGWVKDVRAADVLVDRSMERDVYIPTDSPRGEDDHFTADVLAAEVTHQGWADPPVV